MKLILCYSVFNGEELLQASIDNHIDLVDEIIICYQLISNKGNKNDALLSYLSKFRGKKTIHFVEYHPDLRLNTKENERKKHNLMVESARKLNATHFILAACDHFYQKNQFSEAKNRAKNEGFDATFTKMFTYYKHFTWQITPIEDYCMPFICKLSPETRIERAFKFPVRVDPSVQINTLEKYYVFKEDEIMLHHFSMIRNDVKNKFENAASSIRWTQDQVKLFASEYNSATLESKISYFGNRGLIEVENYFNFHKPAVSRRHGQIKTKLKSKKYGTKF